VNEIVVVRFWISGRNVSSAHRKLSRTDEDKLMMTATEEEVPSLLWNAEGHRHVVE